MPNLTIMAPKDGAELEAMMEFAENADGPCAIRYPRGSAHDTGFPCDVQYGKAQPLKEGRDVEIWALGAMNSKALEAADILAEKGVSAGVVNMSFVAPFDRDRLIESARTHSLIVTVEDNTLAGGAGETVNSILINEDVRVINIGWPVRFIEHGTCEELYSKYDMDGQAIAERILGEFEG